MGADSGAAADVTPAAGAAGEAAGAAGEAAAGAGCTASAGAAALSPVPIAFTAAWHDADKLAAFFRRHSSAALPPVGTEAQCAM